jgi:RNA 3'-terminal phosphate cyclase (ATP)
MSFIPLIARMGPTVEAHLDRPGFYPAGGGRFTVRVEPAPRLAGFELHKRGEISTRSTRVLIARLPRHIAEREVKVIEEKLGWPAECMTIEEIKTSPGPGNIVLIEVGCAEVTEVFAAFGERGVKAERVAQRAVDQAQRHLSANVPIGEHLADQLLLPLALAGHGAFTTLPPTAHTQTNIDVIRRFLNVDISSQAFGQDTWRIQVGPSATKEK